MVQVLIFHVQNNEKSSTRISKKPNSKAQAKTQEIFIFQVTIHEQSILNLLFFPVSLEEWFHLDPSIRNSVTINAFKQKLLPFTCPLENSVFNIFDPEGLKIFTRLGLGSSHLNEYRFRHNFEECLIPLCTCSLETENTAHYLLHCHHSTFFLIDLTNNVKTVLLTLSHYQTVKKLEFAYMETLGVITIKIILYY